MKKLLFIAMILATCNVKAELITFNNGDLVVRKAQNCTISGDSWTLKLQAYFLSSFCTKETLLSKRNTLKIPNNFRTEFSLPSGNYFAVDSLYLATQKEVDIIGTKPDNSLVVFSVHTKVKEKLIVLPKDFDNLQKLSVDFKHANWITIADINIMVNKTAIGIK
jgi:hypothetical protein